MKFFSLLATGLLFACQAAFAQTITVRDQSTLRAVPDVAITVKSAYGKILLTDNKGRAELGGIGETDSLHFRKLGFQQITISHSQLQQRNFEVLLSDEVFTLQEVVFSTGKFAETRERVPQQVQVIEAKDLAFMSQPTTAEVLQQSGEVLVQKSQQGGGSPIIRGFEANKVLLVVDGVRLNNAIFRGGHLQNLITIDNALLERLEVIAGPGTAVYGSDALGGVVHLYTKNPLLADSTSRKRIAGTAFTRYATANQEKTGHLDLSLGSAKLGVLAGVTVSDFDDLRAGRVRNPFYERFGEREVYQTQVNGQDSAQVNQKRTLQRNSGYRQTDGLLKLLYRPNSTWSHILIFQGSTSTNIPRYDRLTEFRNGQLRFGDWYYGPQERLFASYRLIHASDHGFYDQAELTAAYQVLKESRHDRRFGSTTLNNRFEKVNVYSANLDLRKALGNHELRYGAELTSNTVTSTAHSLNIRTDEQKLLDTRYPDGGSGMQTAAVYLTNRWQLNERFSLSAGARGNLVRLEATFRDTSFFNFPFRDVIQRSTAVNGHAGITYNTPSDWKFSALASSGFRAPNVDDLAKVFESVQGRLVVPNPDLKPERTYNAELTVQKRIAGTVRVSGTGFHTWYRNAITLQPARFQGNDSVLYQGEMSRVLSSQNTGKATIYGFSGNISADITQHFALTSTLTYTHGRLATDSVAYPLDHIAPVYGRTAVQLTLRQFRAEFFALYNGWKRLKDYNLIGEDNFQYATAQGMPAWYTLNLRTAYQFNPHLQLQASLENILDVHYRVFASGISAPGRNLILTLRGTF